MNNSSQPITESQDGRPATSFSILRTAAYCGIFTLGLVGNIFVLVALKRKRRRTANDWFILNLTISDLLFIVCLASDVYVELDSKPYNTFFCKGLRPLSTVMYSATVFTMTTMALERYQVITKPFQPRMEQGRAGLVIGGIWILSIISVVPLPIVTTAGTNECVEPGWPAPIYSTIYTVTLVAIQYLLPLSIITAAYIGIVIYLWKEKASQRALNIRSDSALRAARKDNMQVVKAVLTVVVFFAVCMLPNQLAWLLWEFGRTTHQQIANRLLKFSPITGYLHSCANPIIYGTFMKYFREEFKTLLRKFPSCCCPRRCVWRRRRRVQHTPAHIGPQKIYNYTGDDNFIINNETRMRRSRIVNKETQHKDNFGLAMEADEPEVQETRL